MAAPPCPVVICGPSGVGKGTLIAKLIAEFPDKFGFSVSHTTRAPRPGEENGVHYHFAEKKEMETQIANGEFLEHARVHENVYGTSVQSVKLVSQQHKICILDIDVQGAEIVKRSDLNAVFLFVAPPSLQELERRLRGRGTEKEDSIAVRLANASKEMAKIEVDGFFDAVVVNDDLDKAYAEIKKTILR
jgi:guanylate kinase